MEVTIHWTRAKVLWLVGAGLVVVGVGLGWYFLARPVALLPASITNRIYGFSLYFYEHNIPGGYNVDASQVIYSGQVLMVPLTKPNAPTIVLTEQPLPNIPDDNIQQNGEGVTVSTGKATINNIEGRLVGTLIPSDRHTLILLNAPGEANKDDLKVLLQELRPLKS